MAQNRGNNMQPMAAGSGQSLEYTGEFAAGLFDCCSDCKNCIMALLCGPCFMFCLFSDAGECGCTPFLCPSSYMMLRPKLRAHFKIQGALWKDVLTIAFCGFCSNLQLAKELKHQGVAKMLN